jgi:hypothetical protein
MKENDANREINSKYEEDLFVSILGSYDLNDLTKIYPDQHRSDNEIIATHIHESTHRKIVSSTIFGVIQNILAKTTQQYPALSALNDVGFPRWMEKASVLLGNTITLSWNTHEGYAVFRENKFREYWNLGNESAELPQKYLRAYEKFLNIEKLIPDNLKAFSLLIIQCIVEFCMNSTILSFAPISSWDNSLTTQLSIPENSPDFRLEKICESFASYGFSIELSTSLENEFENLLRKYNLSIGDSLPKFVSELMSGLNENNNQFFISLLEVVSYLTERELSTKCPSLGYIPGNKITDEIGNYIKSSTSFFEKYKLIALIPVDAKEVSTFDRIIGTDNVEILTTNNFNMIHKSYIEFTENIQELIQFEGLFILEFGMTPKPKSTKVNATMLYTLTIIPLAKMEIKENADNDGATFTVTPTWEKFYVWGSWRNIKKIVDILKDKIYAYVANLTVVDTREWEIDANVTKYFKNQNTRSTVIFPWSKGRDVDVLLRVFRKFGVKNIVPIYETDQMNVLLFSLTNDTELLVKIKNTLTNTYSKYQPEMLDWIKSKIPTSSKAMEDIPPTRYYQLHLIAELEYYGAFLSFVE